MRVVFALCFLVTTIVSSSCLFSLSPETVAATKNHAELLDLLNNLAVQKDWEAVLSTLRTGIRAKTLSEQDIDRWVKQHPSSPIEKATIGGKNIAEKTDLKFYKAFLLAFFAETVLPERVLKGETFWPEQKFGRDMQYDPETGKFFIHLGTKGENLLGIGQKKTVSKTILYDRNNPTILARGTSRCSMEEEMSSMKALSGLPGIIEAEALMYHEDHGTISTIVTPIYNSGSLYQVLDDNNVHLTFSEKLSIAIDITTGLSNMHQAGYVHRDLSARNYFVDIAKSKSTHRTIKAVVADLGRTIPLENADAVPAQGNKTYLSPEAFFPKNMHHSDYCKSDVFALGCVLWRLFFEEVPSWQKERIFSKESHHLKNRQRHLLHLIKHSRSKWLSKIRAKEQQLKTLSPKDRFVRVILHMIDPDPHSRISATLAKEALLAIR